MVAKNFIFVIGRENLILIATNTSKRASVTEWTR